MITLTLTIEELRQLVGDNEITTLNNLSISRPLARNPDQDIQPIKPHSALHDEVQELRERLEAQRQYIYLADKKAVDAENAMRLSNEAYATCRDNMNASYQREMATATKLDAVRLIAQGSMHSPENKLQRIRQLLQV